ncbi:MAG: Rpn family recombination-promoting nuclease/putative transposase [Holosporaceae bacterium]|jgi:predicted transposase/invertase (TIGR01784 family)|nr:Rpn family recombination-promoting nuclease/putative transposase [Holosporaceae bacterium]
MTDLLDPKQDYIFKNIFGVEQNKGLLISFLNALFKGNPHIIDLSFDNPNIEKILEKDKASRLDIKATTDNKTKIDIEIQIKNTGEIPQRAFHYLANMMPRIVKKGKSYKGPKVIGIWILGENVTERQNAIGEAYMTFQPQDPDPYQIMTDSARIIFIELAKFNPKKADRRDLLTAWLSFLKDPIFMDESFLQVEEVHEAMETLKYISADDEIRAISDLRQKTINDRNSEMTVAEERGIAIGEERGEAVGRNKEKKEMALKLLSKGMDIKDVAEIAELTESDIRRL